MNGFEWVRIEGECVVGWLGLFIFVCGVMGVNDVVIGRGVGGGVGGERERRRVRCFDGGGFGERICG